MAPTQLFYITATSAPPALTNHHPLRFSPQSPAACWPPTKRQARPPINFRRFSCPRVSPDHRTLCAEAEDASLAC
ncbi:unnamed protein product [Urochloa humidicola]